MARTGLAWGSQAFTSLARLWGIIGRSPLQLWVCRKKKKVYTVLIIMSYQETATQRIVSAFICGCVLLSQNRLLFLLFFVLFVVGGGGGGVFYSKQLFFTLSCTV